MVLAGVDYLQAIYRQENTYPHLLEKGIELWMMARACDVEVTDGRLEAVGLTGGERLEADAFVEATGSAGPQGNCKKYGNGCAMCVLRCPSWGGRVSIAARAGVDLEARQATYFRPVQTGRGALISIGLSAPGRGLSR